MLRVLLHVGDNVNANKSMANVSYLVTYSLFEYVSRWVSFLHWQVK